MTGATTTEVAIRTAELCGECHVGIQRVDETGQPFKLCDHCAAKTMPIADAEAEAASLERDAAISLLLEAPAECSTFAPLPKRCGTCWTCRVDKFLRDAGMRR